MVSGTVEYRMICKQVLVSGLVQGVFFRDSTRRYASELGLTGAVRNRRNGQVEVFVLGEEGAVDSLIKWLEIGPKRAKVTTIEVIDLGDETLLDCSPGVFDIWATQ